MKAKLIEKEKELKFQPITIQLTIENEMELCALWHRLNMSVSSIEGSDYKSIGDLKYSFEDDNSSLWNIIDEQIAKNRLKE